MTPHRNRPQIPSPYADDLTVWSVGERERILPRLVPVTPMDLADRSAEGRKRILDLVARALGSERRRGRARHWSYSLDRHVALIRALEAEAALWRSERGTRWRPSRTATVVRPMRAPSPMGDVGRNEERRGS